MSEMNSNKKECDTCGKKISTSNMARHKKVNGCNQCFDCSKVLTENVKCTRCLKCYKKHLKIVELNLFIDRMNSQYDTCVPHLGINKNIVDIAIKQI
jgi:hypothetical protein